LISINCPICNSTQVIYKISLGNKVFPVNISICKECGFVFQNPRFTRSEWNNYYLTDYDEFHRPIANDAKVDNSADLIAQRIETVFSNITNNNILEIGAGVGDIVISLKRRFVNNEYFAVEPSNSCANILAKNGINVIASTIEEISEEHCQQYDIIIARHVLEHFYQPLESLRIIAKLLKRDGVLYIAVPNLGGTQNIIESFYFPHISYFNMNTLSLVCQYSGLKELVISVVNNELYGLFIIDTKHKYINMEMKSNYIMTTELLNSINIIQLIKKLVKRKVGSIIPIRVLKYLLKCRRAY